MGETVRYHTRTSGRTLLFEFRVPASWQRICHLPASSERPPADEWELPGLGKAQARLVGPDAPDPHELFKAMADSTPPLATDLMFSEKACPEVWGGLAELEDREGYLLTRSYRVGTSQRCNRWAYALTWAEGWRLDLAVRSDAPAETIANGVLVDELASVASTLAVSVE